MKKKSQSDRVNELHCDSNPSESMSPNIRKQLYVVKAWDGTQWKYFSTLYLNPTDSQSQKQVIVQELKSLFGKHLKYKISNVSDCYFEEL